MQPNQKFLDLPEQFWANVRYIGQEIGYSRRGTGTICKPTLAEIVQAYQRNNVSTNHLVDKSGNFMKLGSQLADYMKFRADVLNNYVEPNLMDVDKARQEFENLKASLLPQCPIPMNKQKGEKKAPAYFTGIINMLIEANSGEIPCNFDPRKLAVLSRNGEPVYTFARRFDGAFPDILDPIAVWEIKEYYYTTTFGSRVADGVYETLLDGMEIKRAFDIFEIDTRHLLMIDSHYTWWECGRSYLCRIIDMLHMGFVDEVLFGAEVIDRLPSIVSEWVEAFAER